MSAVSLRFTGDRKLTALPVQGWRLQPGRRFSEAISLVITCADQAEVDYYWDRLTDGGQEVACGWVTDRYGLSWPVVPAVLAELMSDPDPARAKRVAEAMFTMQKLDIAALQDAYAAG